MSSGPSTSLPPAAGRLDGNRVARQLVTLLNRGTVTPRMRDCSPDDVVKWCQRNKFPLLALVDRLPPWLADSPEYAQAMAAEAAAFATQHREYQHVREAWLARGVPCLMIKSADEQPSFPYTSDNLDILVRPEHGPIARDALRVLGYVEVRSVEEPQKHLFRKFHGGECVSAIHVHERIAWFVGFLDDDAVWQRSRVASDDPSITIPSAEDATLINLAHACYENKRLRLNEIMRIRTSLTAAGSDLDWEYMDAIATSRGWRDGWAFMLLAHSAVETALFGETLIPAQQRTALEAIVRGDSSVWKRLETIRASDSVDLPLDLSYLFCKRLYYRKIFADRTRVRGERWRDVAATLMWGIRLKSRLRPQAGYVVSLSGVDGSGKTAHAVKLVDALRLCELKADYRWSRGGSTGLAGIVSWLRHAWRQHSQTGAAPQDAITRRRRELAHPGQRFLWSWLIALDGVLSSYRDVLASRMRGRVIVKDRHLYDTAVELDASLPSDAHWSRSAIAFLLRFGWPGDSSYVLDIDAVTARQRKMDESWHTQFEAEREEYLRLASRFGLKVRSNDGSFAQTSDPLIHDVIMDYMARFETRLNALFYANPSQKNVPDPIWAKGAAR